MAEKNKIVLETVEAEVVNEVEIVQPAKIEFRLINPTEDGFLRVIKWNKEELEAAVRQKIADYENVVYTEDNMKKAKADRAELNGLINDIEDRRKLVKKIINKPYDIFEAEVKNILVLIQEPVSIIDKQIKEYGEQIKEEKKAALKTYFYETATDLEGILTFDRVFDQRYLNVSFSLNKAKADIQEKVDRVHTDLKSLETFCDGKYLTIAKDAYIRTLNVSDALAETKRLQEFDRKAEEERLRREEKAEEARLAAEAKAAESKAAKTKTAENVTEIPKNVTKEAENVTEPTESVSKPVENVTEQAEVIPSAVPAGGSIDIPDTSAGSEKVMEKDNKPCKASFTVYGTKAQIMALREYMIQHNIKFGKVEK